MARMGHEVAKGPCYGRLSIHWELLLDMVVEARYNEMDLDALLPCTLSATMFLDPSLAALSQTNRGSLPIERGGQNLIEGGLRCSRPTVSCWNETERPSAFVEEDKREAPWGRHEASTVKPRSCCCLTGYKMLCSPGLAGGAHHAFLATACPIGGRSYTPYHLCLPSITPRGLNKPTPHQLSESVYTQAGA